MLLLLARCFGLGEGKVERYWELTVWVAGYEIKRS